ncbi:glycosyl transferase family 1 [Elizabethkingia meningoseptica]|uniref:glycosyltransferase n=1 Tax=Elizabethkingia meningoseptica TaxID=238 RepID=UPI000332D593|nr:glycosyltransferase [Elizabethkingia meningoseptica]AQX05557.1 glycosyl transferase family 1 [Elizabethkingia meningoseptica]AQX47602.1 glycosyl transferase family 1 [Elizabethkingia meningoseptica]EOR30428.1 glycosyl transferase, group 1 [Elizabethkingia meningoseptica ATCC 13253 = NBRC 12535]KUY24132.1 glycosyl transferase family 1 [Elizabethkingia meningoseptica]MCL1676221.1 glycosyltransferase [Elizabethkingia meningoseptica]
MKRIEIMFILPDLRPDQEEYTVSMLLKYLPRNTFRPSVLLLHKENYYYTNLKKLNNVEIVDLSVGGKIRNSLTAILRQIKKRNPDIVFCNTRELNVYFAYFSYFFPRVKFITKLSDSFSKQLFRRSARFFYRFYNNYDKIIIPSEDTRNELIKTFKVEPRKLTKIYNSVDFDLIDRKFSDVQKPLYFDNDYKNVVTMGNMASSDEFEHLLHVFGQLKDEKVKLHILSDEKDRGKLQQKKNLMNLENVVFHSTMSNNPCAYIKYSDLFILSCKCDDSAATLLEAGSCGTYVLANNKLGALSEIIQPRINGDMLNIEKHESSARQIMELLQSNKSPESIRLSVESRFSKENVLKQYLDILEEICHFK